jgi:hypothetical protein
VPRNDLDDLPQGQAVRLEQRPFSQTVQFAADLRGADGKKGRELNRVSRAEMHSIVTISGRFSGYPESIRLGVCVSVNPRTQPVDCGKLNVCLLGAWSAG